MGRCSINEELVHEWNSIRAMREQSNKANARNKINFEQERDRGHGMVYMKMVCID